MVQKIAQKSKIKLLQSEVKGAKCWHRGQRAPEPAAASVRQLGSLGSQGAAAYEYTRSYTHSYTHSHSPNAIRTECESKENPSIDETSAHPIVADSKN